MSRRKKRNTHRPETQPEPARTTPEPNPPRPNPPLLVFAIILAVLWAGVLLALALFT